MDTLHCDDFVRLATLEIPDTVTAIAFSPDGSMLAVASEDNVHIYQVPMQVRATSTSGSSTPVNPLSAGS